MSLRMVAVNLLKLLVPGEGIEPPTFGLQNRCSTAELTRRTGGAFGLLSASRPGDKRGFGAECTPTAAL